MSKNYEIIKKGMNEFSFISYPKKRWFGIIFIHLWLIGWLFGEVSVIDTLFFDGVYLQLDSFEKENEVFLYIWLTIWTFGGLFALFQLLWMLFGEEKVKIDRHNIEITRVLALLRKRKKYEIDQILNFRVKLEEKPTFNEQRKANSFFTNYGSLRFSYKGKEVKFGLDLSKKEALIVYENFRDISRFTNLKIE